MFKVTITFGTEYDKNGERINPDRLGSAHYYQIREEICKQYGGYTLTNGLGGYCYEAGDLVEEDSTSISILMERVHYPDLEAVANSLKELFEQESVILLVENVKKFQFI